MKTRPLFIATFLFGLSALLHAQDSKTVAIATSARGSHQSAQEIEDIGEIEEKPTSVRDKFRFSVTTRGQYTSNALLTGNHGSSDFLFLPTIEGGFHTPLGKH